MHERRERAPERASHAVPPLPKLCEGARTTPKLVGRAALRCASCPCRGGAGAPATGTTTLVRCCDPQHAQHSPHGSPVLLYKDSVLLGLRQADVDAQLQERRRARALLASITLEQDSRQARETMAACRQQMEARASRLPQ